MKQTCVSLLAVLALSCGGDNPVAPSSTPPPAPVPPSAPVVRTLRFEPDRPAPIDGLALSVQVGSRGQEPGTVSIALVAHGIDHLFKVRGDLRWDPALLTYDNWGQGEWFGADALVDWTHYTNQPGEFAMFLDRPTTARAAVGTGEIVLVRLRARPGVTGTSLVQLDEPKLYDSGFRSLTPSRIYGGKIVIE